MQERTASFQRINPHGEVEGDCGYIILTLIPTGNGNGTIQIDFIALDPAGTIDGLGFTGFWRNGWTNFGTFSDADFQCDPPGNRIMSCTYNFSPGTGSVFAMLDFGTATVDGSTCFDLPVSDQQDFT